MWVARALGRCRAPLHPHHGSRAPEVRGRPSYRGTPSGDTPALGQSLPWPPLGLGWFGACLWPATSLVSMPICLLQGSRSPEPHHPSPPGLQHLHTAGKRAGIVEGFPLWGSKQSIICPQSAMLSRSGGKELRLGDRGAWGKCAQVLSPGSGLENKGRHPSPCCCENQQSGRLGCAFSEHLRVLWEVKADPGLMVGTGPGQLAPLEGTQRVRELLRSHQGSQVPFPTSGRNM